MHPNPIFHPASDADNLAFAKKRGFGSLAVNHEDGPLISHIPFIIKDGYINAHLVRSNPIARMLKDHSLDAVLAVQGPDAYISPDWYGVEDQVPTWNYVSVHLRGKLKLLDSDMLLSHLVALSENFENKLEKTPWRIDKMSKDSLQKMMRMIVPITMSVEVVDGTWKLSQNKPKEVSMRAVNGLKDSTVGFEIAELAGMMEASVKEK